MTYKCNLIIILFHIFFCRLKILVWVFLFSLFSLKSTVEGGTISNIFSVSLPIFIFYLCTSGSQLRAIFAPKETFLAITNWGGGGMLLVYSRQRQGTLLNILQCIVQLPTTIIQPQNVSATKLR